jgi:glutamyl-tRNA(Gln) amidotransferase subunit D
LVTSGLVIPRYEHAESDYIVLKLKSGYNMGLRSSSIKKITVLEEPIRSARTESKTEISAIQKGRNLLLLSTGGTIASRVDYRTGAVHPALSALDLYKAIPELGEVASIEPEVVFSVYSENMGPLEWQQLSKIIIARSKAKSPSGVVVMIGTDTLAYTAAALSFSLLGHDKPVVLVGAQRSTDRPSSDGPINLKAASTFAVESGLPGVFVAMHESENDDSVAIHSGVRVRKNHTSRRDAFESIDMPLIARVKDREILKLGHKTGPDGLPDSFKLKTNFEQRVSLIKFHPGFDSSILAYLNNERKIRGLIIEGSGLGHVSSEAVTTISKLTDEGVFVGITSQCIWGHVDLNVYETGRDMIGAGAVPLENMIGETALAKLSWTLGNFDDVEQVMLTNFVGEFTERIGLNTT